MKALASLAPLLLLVTACASAQAPRARAARVVVLARHLDNPRGVALGMGGAVYVAEAGHGGVRCGRNNCVGFTARIGRYRAGRYVRVARNLLSVADADPPGLNTRGLDDVDLAPNGDLYGVEAGLAGVDRFLVTAAVRAQAERVVRVKAGKKVWSPRLGAYERAHNPDGEDVETDPYGIAATSRIRYVVDAGGNDLLRTAHGRVALVGVFPRLPHAQSVPTSVTVGPDGALYVGEFTGGRPGLARVWRVVPGHKPAVFRRGFTQISGIAFGPDRSLYVTEGSLNANFGASPGDIVRVRRNGTRTSYGRARLVAPAGAAVDAKGRIYVSNHSIRSSAGGVGGELVRLDP